MKIDLIAIKNENLPEIKSYFLDKEIQKYLGGKDWIEKAPQRINESIGNEFRGAKVLDRIGYIAYLGSKPIGYLEAEVYDKHTQRVIDRNKKAKDIIISEETTAAIVYVIFKPFRNKGLGKQLVSVIIEKLKSMDVSQIIAGTEPENIPSQKTLESNRFITLNNTPDPEGMINWALHL